jgi:hypothetical protein
MQNKLFKDCADLTNGKITPEECGIIIAEGWFLSIFNYF